MSTLSDRPLLPTFLPNINALLAALALPFAIDHPTDLTPSLLLAVFESLISARLPIPASVRQSRTRDAKARAMLVLLGVLECDVLRGGTSSDADHSLAAPTAEDSMLGGAGGVSVDGWVDEIGLGEVDPERLADGGWEETIFVGELLCWLARRRGVLPRIKSSSRSSHQRSLYSNHHSYGTECEGDSADFSTSLLLRPSSSQNSRSPRPPSPSYDVDVVTDADFSALSHITDVPRHPLVHSPEPSLSASATTGTDLSIRARSVSSRTSVSNVHDDPDESDGGSQDTIHMYNSRQMMQDADDDDDRPPTFRPRCIHELEDPSYIRALGEHSLSFDPSAEHERISGDISRDADDHADDPYGPHTPTPRRVRLTGSIGPVDSATELSQFDAWRAHLRLHAFRTSSSSDSGPSRLQSHILPRASELSRPTLGKPSPRLRQVDKPRTPRRASPSPSPSPPPSSPPATQWKHPLTRSHPRSPSPPSPSADSDPPFDVSFSTLNNTSTPAKPRSARRAPLQSTTTRQLDRPPSYTPSSPSFSTPRSRAGAGANASARSGPTGSVKTPMSAGASTTAAPTTTRRSRRASPEPASSKGKSLQISPPGSTTATTNSLLTERARLLTELAALKRARAMSNAGPGTNGAVGRRVGVGV